MLLTLNAGTRPNISDNEEEDENIGEAGQVQHQQQDTDGYSLGN